VTEPILAQVRGDPTPQLGQELPEPLHPPELFAVSMLAPQRVIEVLLAARRIDSGGLEMAERVLADPHVAPCRWDGQTP
jgi:hypothetical protein